MTTDLQVRRDDLAVTRLAQGPPLEPGPGQVLLRVDAFGLTANNITYARLGERLRYWDFFPAAGAWGRVPAWGYAEVLAAREADVPPGARVFGFVPMGTHLLATVNRGDGAGFTDRSAHRAGLPAAYNHYTYAGTDPVRDATAEALRLTVWPLFLTSYLLADLLAEHGRFGATRILLSSASSRTAAGLAFLLAAHRPGIEVIGLTSPANLPYTTSLGVYDQVLDYAGATRLPEADTAYVDFAGDSAITAAVHHHHGDRLRASIRVGHTHGAAPAGALPGPPPRPFLSPERIRERARTWGLHELLARIEGAWQDFRPAAATWFPVVHHTGLEAARRAYLDTLAGRTPPGAGHVLALRPPADRP
ncbi:DUF2855 family protein [Streptomyces sp. NPDC051940]|uniref:DUF2855 family protein n=1 Tax=Streptomyces sp. NPDC051940 TaxID=3155675 RepID=UPI00343707D2